MGKVFNLDLFSYSMQFWTHLSAGIFAALVLFSFVHNPFLFGLIVIISSLLPDIDTPTSKLGRNNFSKTLTAFFKHRGVIHSVFFMLLVYFFLLMFWHFAALPFLVGYSVHLLLDLLTPRGLRLFWPFKFRIKGFVRSGGLLEVFVFVIFLILDCALISIHLLGL